VKSVPTIVITGFMGSGKTAVAQSLATHLNVDLIDLDQFITNAVGRTPAQIISQDGEPAFRAIETDALTRLLQTASAGVIALGGGTWIEEANRTLIEENNCLTIWLDTPFEECWKRIQSSDEERPLGKTEQQSKELFERRRASYEKSTLHLKVLPDETADILAARLERLIAETLNVE
jgi:shikimate kinase